MRRGSPVSSMVGKVASSSSKNTRPSRRARCTPRQKCSPMPNERCGFGWRWMSNASRVVEHGLVAVGRRVVHRHLVAGRDRHVVQHGVGGGGAPEVVERVGPPQDLLDRAGDERRVGAQLGELVGVVEQREQPRRQHRLGGVVAGGDELHEEAAEVEVGHRPAAEVALQDQRGEVFAGGLGAARARELDGVHRHVDVGVGRRGLVAAALAGLPFGHGAGHSGSWPLVFCSAQLLDLVPVLAGEAHQLADHLRGQVRRRPRARTRRRPARARRR